MELASVAELEKELAALMKRKGVTRWMEVAFDAQDIEWLIKETMLADAEEVVRCKDCQHWGTGHPIETAHGKICKFADWLVGANGYCVYGERKESNGGE